MAREILVVTELSKGQSLPELNAKVEILTLKKLILSKALLERGLLVTPNKPLMLQTHIPYYVSTYTLSFSINLLAFYQLQLQLQIINNAVL